MSAPFPIPTLVEFSEFIVKAEGDSFKAWCLTLNNFHFNLPYYAAGNRSEVKPGYYWELNQENESLDEPNRLRYTDRSRFSEQFLGLTPRQFDHLICETVREIGFMNKILCANGVRMFGSWQTDRSWLYPVGLAYVALRMKGFNRADLTT